MGDLAVLENVNLLDTLYADRYLCGQGSDNSISTVRIMKNEKLICERSNKNSGYLFSSKVQLAEIFNSGEISKGDILDIYFQLDTESEPIDEYSEFILLGKIKIK